MADTQSIDNSTNMENDLQILKTYNEEPDIFNFEEGNIGLIDEYFNLTYKKVTTIKNSVLPIIEASLIELLGSSIEYKRSKCETVISYQGSSPIFELDLEYFVPKFVGIDIKKDSIIEDVTFIYNRLKTLSNVEWKKCSVDCKVGKVFISFKI